MELLCVRTWVFWIEPLLQIASPIVQLFSHFCVFGKIKQNAQNPFNEHAFDEIPKRKCAKNNNNNNHSNQTLFYFSMI